MKIKLDEKHYLNSDQYCYWITCEYEIEKGKGAGSIAERRVSGYRQSFASAVDSFIERKIGGAEINDMKALARIVEQLKTEVQSWKVAVEKGN
jgi:hypothetical protein